MTAHLAQTFLGLAVIALMGCAPAPHTQTNGKTDFNIGVVGGTRVAAGSSLSKQVALLDNRCTATFIDRHIVLTAGHCFPERNTTGSIEFTDDGNTATFKTTYDDVRMHPEFDPYMNSSAHDIAVLRTIDPLPENFELMPLANGMLSPKSIVTAAGRGLRNYAHQLGPQYANDHLLRTVELNVWKLAKAAGGNWYVLKIDEKAGVSGGDSGGPLLAQEDGLRKQFAVASTIGNDSTGGDVAYAPVAPNLNWIRSASAELLQKN